MLRNPDSLFTISSSSGCGSGQEENHENHIYMPAAGPGYSPAVARPQTGGETGAQETQPAVQEALGKRRPAAGLTLPRRVNKTWKRLL